MSAGTGLVRPGGAWVRLRPRSSAIADVRRSGEATTVFSLLGVLAITAVLFFVVALSARLMLGR